MALRKRRRDDGPTAEPADPAPAPPEEPPAPSGVRSREEKPGTAPKGKKEGRERTKKGKARLTGLPGGAPDPEAPLVHSSQLEERLRRGDVEATPEDRRRRVYFDLLMAGGFLLIVTVMLGALKIGLDFNVAEQTLVLAVATGVLSGASFLFTTIRWRALRKSKGTGILDKSRTDFLLTTVSIVALFTVVVMVIVEILALLVFLNVIEQVGSAGIAFAANFVLFQTFMLLVYLMALVVREGNPSSYRPAERSVMASKILSPAAGFFVLVGILLDVGLLQRAGVLTSIEVHQAVYVITLGVLLEFMAMRIRLRLPSLWSRFKEAVDVSRRANEEIRKVLQKRAMRTYLFALFFVAASMAFAGAIATGNVALGGGRTTVALTIFYVGFALITLGVIAVRIFQGRNLEQEGKIKELGIEVLLERKRRSPEEIFRLSVYAVTGFLAAIALVLAVLIGIGQFADTTTETVEVEGDRPGQVVEEEQEVTTGIHPRYATDVALLGLLLAAGPFGIFYNRELKRIESIDEKFPDFLRDIAESARAGMTLPRALVTAARGTYGALTPEVRKMAAQVEWGVDFKEALERFAQRARTPLIDRTVSLVVEAQRAGGNVVDVLTAASDDAREIKQIVSERNEQMKMYKVVVFIAYFVFIAVVMILSAQFIPAFKEASGAASGQQVGGIKFKEVDVDAFNTLFFHAAIVQAIGGGLVGGVLTRGKAVAGFGSIVVMVIIAWFSFRLLIGIM